MSCYERLEFLALLCTCGSLIYAIWVQVSNTNSEKRLRTYNAIDALYEKHDELASKNLKNDYMDFVRFTRNVDRFAASYNTGLFDRNTVKERAGKFLVRIYDEKLSEIIAQQRKQFKRDTYFSHVECMINDLRKQ